MHTQLLIICNVWYNYYFCHSDCCVLLSEYFILRIMVINNSVEPNVLVCSRFFSLNPPSWADVSPELSVGYPSSTPGRSFQPLGSQQVSRGSCPLTWAQSSVPPVGSSSLVAWWTSSVLRRHLLPTCQQKRNILKYD